VVRSTAISFSAARTTDAYNSFESSSKFITVVKIALNILFVYLPTRTKDESRYGSSIIPHMSRMPEETKDALLFGVRWPRLLVMSISATAEYSDTVSRLSNKPGRERRE
jgi:hypothetical protein